MKQYLKHDAWKIIEEGFTPQYNRISESVFSIGNGRFGQRANFEEDYSGDSLQGNYVAGVYYPDKTRVGWWKNGYPEYFAKVLNAADWTGISIEIDGEKLDLATCKILSFTRELDMKQGLLSRSFEVRTPSNHTLKVSSERFCSIADDETAAIRYKLTLTSPAARISVTPYIDGDVINEDSNYDEKFWVELAKETGPYEAYLNAATKKTDFHVCTGMQFSVRTGGKKVDVLSYAVEREKYAGCSVEFDVEKDEEICIHKYVGIVSSQNHDKDKLMSSCKAATMRASSNGFETMKAAQAKAWGEKWTEADIVVDGDVAAQQGIRFNIFQLYQTYTGEDERLNIGPKGFTGEKYGGSTYWDTEAYCLPFYLATADQHVARNLLLYRYKQLGKAIENAEKLGFRNGAALFPMVTMNGEECHNEWEITFEEIHRNGAIAYGVYDYINYTGEQEYLIDYGLELLIAIARFWSQRFHYSTLRNQYVMHGVTGPNEYENNVNNNWYTSYIARWCLNYTMESLEYVKEQAPEKLLALTSRINFDEGVETEKWKEISGNVYLPEDKDKGVFIQHDGFLDKELIPVSELDPASDPLCQNWSWDRILRSCYIKQADVLQGLYFFEQDFDEDTHRRNFDFYEPFTVHESSLSPCVHAILAGKLGKEDKAYEMYLRTARLDLDDYNNDTEDGCHITSMAGTWMAFVKGFGGMRVFKGVLHLQPYMPESWKAYSFNVQIKHHFVKVSVNQSEVSITNRCDDTLELVVYGNQQTIAANDTLVLKR